MTLLFRLSPSRCCHDDKHPGIWDLLLPDGPSSQSRLGRTKHRLGLAGPGQHGGLYHRLDLSFLKWLSNLDACTLFFLLFQFSGLHHPMTLIFVFLCAGFALGWGPIPWLVMSEIFPVKVRGFASAVCVLTNWSMAFFITKTFQDMMVSHLKNLKSPSCINKGFMLSSKKWCSACE